MASTEYPNGDYQELSERLSKLTALIGKGPEAGSSSKKKGKKGKAATSTKSYDEQCGDLKQEIEQSLNDVENSPLSQKDRPPFGYLTPRAIPLARWLAEHLRGMSTVDHPTKDVCERGEKGVEGLVQALGAPRPVVGRRTMKVDEEDEDSAYEDSDDGKAKGPARKSTRIAMMPTKPTYQEPAAVDPDWMANEFEGTGSRSAPPRKRRRKGGKKGKAKQGKAK